MAKGTAPGWGTGTAGSKATKGGKPAVSANVGPTPGAKKPAVRKPPSA
jgi:hypothetical protein